ncbi:hypothetical protein BCR36DRAFT_307733 [Piromyces finnis]|uniref:Chitin-binding type-1 domain-containing protein n=1 Tax=Piromyces finnis TaxID=1754191 RepID=A0A1Y1UYD5_9FUNG|nr:hypothetical protein BCR36DRAFT_307733 [Piromyces finnis]|eukprot:ORX42283.1 hypothetical protein BCR36DRAFT_307733 [Piromyces finnis]
MCDNTTKKGSCEIRCGKNIGKCPEGQCCSAKGYCGTTSSYCSVKQGCQSKYGKCDKGKCINYGNLTIKVTVEVQRDSL